MSFISTDCKSYIKDELAETINDKGSVMTDTYAMNLYQHDIGAGQMEKYLLQL